MLEFKIANIYFIEIPGISGITILQLFNDNVCLLSYANTETAQINRYKSFSFALRCVPFSDTPTRANSGFVCGG